MSKPNIIVKITNVKVSFDYEWQEDRDDVHHAYATMAGVPNFSISLEQLPKPIQEVLLGIIEDAARHHAADHITLRRKT